MKIILKSASFLVAGLFILSACSEGKMGKSPGKITDKIEMEPDSYEMVKVIQDTVPMDTVEIEKTVAPPPPIEPSPPVPSPGPDPIPVPIPEPLPPDIWIVPEPVPVNPIVDFADIDPEFPGGANEMMRFISETIKYPEIDRDLGNQGRVYVQFVIEKDGSLTNIEVMRGVSETLDREAIRIMRLMPNWKPGESGGKIVRCRSRLPITFRLD